MRGVVLCKSCDVALRMLFVCMIREEKRKKVIVGKRDIYTGVPVISFFNV